MADLTDLMRREAGLGDGMRAHPRVGEVSSYDDDAHAVKVKLQPEGIETGWMPLGALHIGNGYGIAVGANEGDQVVVGFLDGDPNAPFVQGRIYSDQQKAPKAGAGEMVIHHQSGTRTVFAKDGSLTHTHAQGGSMAWAASGHHATDLKGKTSSKKAGLVHHDTPKKVVTGVVHLAAGGTTV